MSSPPGDVIGPQGLTEICHTHPSVTQSYNHVLCVHVVHIPNKGADVSFGYSQLIYMHMLAPSDPFQVIKGIPSCLQLCLFTAMVSLFLKIVANDSDSTVDSYVGLDIHRAIFYIPVPCHVFWMAESAQGCQCLLSIDSVGFFCKIYPIWVLLHRIYT